MRQLAAADTFLPLPEGVHVATQLAFVLAIGTWLYLRSRFVRLLKALATGTWKELGEPALLLDRSWFSQHRIESFVARKRHLELQSPDLVRAGKRLRWAQRLQLYVMTLGVCVYFVPPVVGAVASF